MTTMLSKEHERIACDVNARNLRMAKSTEYKNIAFVLYDAHALPFESKAFDDILLIDALEHLKSPISALKEARRVAKRQNIINVLNNNFSKVIYK